MQQKSEVSQLMSRVRAEHEAAERGLHGLADGMARHAFIEARAARRADVILQLMHAGKHAEAIALMEIPDWGRRASDDVGGEEGCQKRFSSLSNSTSR